jgi:hypothetical protein
MKQGFLFLFFCCAFTFAENNFSMGARLGVSLNHFGIRTFVPEDGYDDYNDIDPFHLGYEAGITLNIPLIARFNLISELNCIYRDFTWVHAFGRREHELNLKEIVIGVPLLLQIKPVKHGSFMIGLGAQFDIPVISMIYIRDKKDNEALADVNMKNRNRKVLDIGFIPLAWGFNIKNIVKIESRFSIHSPKENSVYGGGSELLKIDLGVTYYFKRG